jgi:hypothetical protein
LPHGASIASTTTIRAARDVTGRFPPRTWLLYAPETRYPLRRPGNQPGITDRAASIQILIRKNNE